MSTNKQGLNRIIDLVERGVPLMAGEVKILREAVDLLDDMATTLDRIIGGASPAAGRFDAETTAQLRAIGDDDARGRP